MPEFIMAQLYCPACGHELDGQADFLPGFVPHYELWCLGCGWTLYDREAKYEHEAALIELGKDIPVGGLHLYA